jgi:glycine dehydrogenase subunit 1
MSRFSYIPHTDADVETMLDRIGVENVDSLFADVPQRLRETGYPDIPRGISEIEVVRELERLASLNQSGVSFLGGGSYDHLIPHTVPYVTGRSEFLTAYTPYQAEISQGVLQAIFEYQTMISMITGLPVPNASLYDGATAAVEACAMAVQAKRGASTIAVSSTVHPNTRRVLETYFSDLGVEIIEIGMRDGETDHDRISRLVSESDRLAALLLQTPNVYGVVERLEGVSAMLHENGVLSIISANPISLGVLASQAELGADIAVGDAQPCGLPSSFGGPSVGYIAATEALMRRMPGRIVGETVDTEGNRAFVLTLQAREQHIKRSRATSNICTNQALAALAVAVYLATLGKRGFRETALQNVHKSHYLARRLAAETKVELFFDKPFFNEFLIRLPVPSRRVVDAFAEEQFFAGIVGADLFGGGFADDVDRMLLVAVTEKRTRAELDRYVDLMKRVTE